MPSGDSCLQPRPQVVASSSGTYGLGRTRGWAVSETQGSHHHARVLPPLSPRSAPKHPA